MSDTITTVCLIITVTCALITVYTAIHSTLTLRNQPTHGKHARPDEPTQPSHDDDTHSPQHT